MNRYIGPTPDAPRMGQPWDEAEDQKLLQSIRKKRSIEEIAKDHQRTVGAIRAHLRQLAAEYWFNDNRTLEEIERFTGLSQGEIQATIQKRIAIQARKEELKPAKSVPASTAPAASTDTEIVTILKEIRDKLALIADKLLAEDRGGAKV